MAEKRINEENNNNIQVYVRLRPLNQRERDMKSSGVVEVVNEKEIVCHSQQTSQTKKFTFTFDRAFGPHAKQVEIYQEVVSPLIEEVLAGFNCTVFTYGQSGTGKTHTMVGESTGDETNWQNDLLAGIIPRSVSHLFDELRLTNTEYAVRVSYLELYNEEFFDLLATLGDKSKLRIYEDVSRKGSNIVHGLEEITIYNKNEVYKIMSQGQERKRVASTLINAQSSRSHTIFTIVVHTKENSPEGEELMKIGKLNLVDLAGSENMSKAGYDNSAKHERARECVNISQSLLTLRRVITALVERHPHIPYRESKLTRILQDSLGGRTKTSIIATVSPGHEDLQETMSTLEYANRARNVQFDHLKKPSRVPPHATEFKEQKQLLEIRKKINRELTEQAKHIYAAVDQTTWHDAKSVEVGNAEAATLLLAELAQGIVRLLAAHDAPARLALAALLNAAEARAGRSRAENLETFMKNGMEAMDLLRKAENKIMTYPGGGGGGNAGAGGVRGVNAGASRGAGPDLATPTSEMAQNCTQALAEMSTVANVSV